VISDVTHLFGDVSMGPIGCPEAAVNCETTLHKNPEGAKTLVLTRITYFQRLDKGGTTT